MFFKNIVETIYPNTCHFFLLQKHTSHTPGESYDSKMSEEEIIEVGFICSVHAMIMLIINTIMLKHSALFFDSVVIAVFATITSLSITMIQDLYKVHCAIDSQSKVAQTQTAVVTGFLYSSGHEQSASKYQHISVLF